jgi:hypothetical protein
VRPEFGEPTDLRFADGSVVDLKDLHRVFALQDVFVDSHDRLDS